jgi:hypothetical protein
LACCGGLEYFFDFVGVFGPEAVDVLKIYSTGVWWWRFVGGVSPVYIILYVWMVVRLRCGVGGSDGYQWGGWLCCVGLGVGVCDLLSSE